MSAQRLWDIEVVKELLPVGLKVRHLGEHHRSGKYDAGRRAYWVNRNGTGKVVSHIKGYPEHACPDHDGGVDCICADDSARVSKSEAVAVVAWEAAYEDGSQAEPIERCLRVSEESAEWERAS